MILKSYLFCLKQNHYIQYPNDNTESFLKPLCRNLKENHQVVVYRDGGLMYYCYLYDNGGNGIVGLCFASGLLCTNLKSLFDRYVNCISFYAKRGLVFHFGNDGSIQIADNFTKNIGEVEELFRWLKEHNESGKMTWDVLPPEDHTISKGSTVFFNFEEDDIRTIVEATRHYTYVVITMRNPIPTSYSKTVKRLSSENEALIKKQAELSELINKINKQKKQYVWVIALAVAVIISALIFIIVICKKNNDIKNQHSTIQNKEITISSQGKKISAQNSTIKTQEQTVTTLHDKVEEQSQTITTLNDKIEELESNYNSLESEHSSITSTYPFKITSIEIGNVYYNGEIETNYGNSLYSARTMYLKPKIYYYGYDSGTRQLKVKLYTPSGQFSQGNNAPPGYSVVESVYIYSGTNTVTLKGYGDQAKGFWSSGTYRIEIWYGDMCVKSKTFTIN